MFAPVAQSVSASYLYVSIDKEMRRSGVRASPGASRFSCILALLGTCIKLTSATELVTTGCQCATGSKHSTGKEL